MTVDQFSAKYPSVFHMTNEANWSSIKQKGLLSTESYCKGVLKLSGTEVRAITSTHRPHALKHDGIILRDQKPMNEGKLISCLQGSGLTPAEWYSILNQRVFFWTTTERLARFKKCYPDEQTKILEVDSAKLLEGHEQFIELCHINSGATRMPDHYRCRDSFQPIAKFVSRSGHRPVELTVLGGVKDILSLLVTS